MNNEQLRTYLYILFLGLFVVFWTGALGNNSQLSILNSQLKNGGRKITNTYAADGRKLQTEAKEGLIISAGTKKYNGNLVFDKNGDLEYILFPEGRILHNAGSFTYEYHLKDHLGSPRVVFVPSGSTATVMQENAYYPFGAPIAALSYNAVGSTNRYKRESKEYIDDFGWDKHDYTSRYFDLWGLLPLSKDPLAEKYPYLSPYALFANNPIRYIDPDGCKFTDAAWMQVNRLIDDINKRQTSNANEIAKKQAQIDAGGLSDKKIASLQKQINNLNSNTTELEGVRGEIATLAGSSQMYDISRDNSMNTTGEYRSAAGFNLSNGNFEIKLGEGSLDKLAHELKHAYQFEKGSYSVGRTIVNSKEYPSNLLYDQSDEVEAYARGTLFGGIPRSAKLISTDPAYENLPKGPIDFRNVRHINNNINNPMLLQKVSNITQHAFRINGITYRPK